MTVAATVRKAGPTPGNSLATVFPFAFKVFVATDIQVILTVIATGAQTVLVLNDPLGYTVALNADQNANPGGSITYNPLGVPLPVTQSLTIISVVPEAQGTHIINGGAFFANNIEDAVDKAVINVQDLAAKVTQSIQFPAVDSAALNAILPAAAARANMAVLFDASGNVIVGAVANAPIAAAWLPVVQAATLGAGRLAMGHSAYFDSLIAAATKAAFTALFTPLTTKGDLWGFAAADARVAVGTNGLLVGANSAQASGLQYLPPNRLTRGRLSLTTGLPVTVADVTAAATVYWTPYQGDTVYIYDGAGWIPFTAAEMSVALDNNAAHTGYQQSGKNFDVFVINDAGTLRIGTGPSWNSGAVGGSDTARGTGAGSTELQMLNGIYTNKNAIDIRFGNAVGNVVAAVPANRATYLGTIRPTADGQTEDSLAKRFLWNNYNRIIRPMRVIETTDSWTYNTAAWRYMNNSAANRIDMVRGLDEDSIGVRSRVIAFNNTATGAIAAGLGVDTNTALTSGVITIGQNVLNVSTYAPFGGEWRGSPGLGFHYIAAIENGNGSGGVLTWGGDVGAPDKWQSGIHGEVMA